MNRVTSVAATAALLLCGTTAYATTERCEVRIGTVIASNSHRVFDSRLEDLRRQFHALFSYTSYRLIKEERRDVAWGRRASFELPGGRYLMVTPQEYKDDRVAMKILLISGSRPVVDTVLMLRNQGTFLVGGPRHDDGVLIISIGARMVRDRQPDVTVVGQPAE